MVDLHREPVDIAIRSGDGQWPGLEAHLLLPSDLTPVCTPQFAENHGGLKRPEDLIDAPRIGLESEWAMWFAAAGLGEVAAAPPAARLVADTQTVEVGLALGGRGLALASPAFFGPEFAQGRLIQPFPIRARYSGGLWVCYPTDRRRAPKIAAFRDWILAQAEADPAIHNPA